MAISDINFQEAEGQDFILELAAGPLMPAEDFLTYGAFGELLYEFESEPAVESNIFIMSE